ncbi:excitatory amino acid transporter 1 domain protein [Ancylostoma ceylanicum]|uniref:Amino acid transporter n=1 Tax=Ancylostoma ceylanicum TaxID=53326 RepID=A0A0D6MC22_9BILA|nr:excitatory amino acid transporter 1 domain protein [Ancylostoma ceylanicum]
MTDCKTVIRNADVAEDMQQNAIEWVLEKYNIQKVQLRNKQEEQINLPLITLPALSERSSEAVAALRQQPIDEQRRHLGFAMVRIAKENILLLFTVAGVVAGIILGISLRDPEVKWNKRHLSYLRFPGDVFVQMLKMLILPLIMSSIITSLASVDSNTAGKLGMISLIYYFMTTMMAVILGIVLVVMIQPGKWMTTNIEEIVGEVNKAPYKTPCRALFPENLVEATFRSHKVCMKFLNGSQSVNPDYVLKMSPEARTVFTELPEKVTSDGMNILGLVMFSVALGITISWIGEEGAALKAFFKSLEAVSMKLISLVIWYSPVGITFLIAAQIVGMKDPGKELQRLMGYMITVLIGLFIHGFVMLPILMITLARRNPVKYVYGMAQALLTALATSSSSATLPLSIKCVEENNGVDSRVARFPRVSKEMRHSLSYYLQYTKVM